jgi:hypothetical protein
MDISVTRVALFFRRPNPDRWFKGDHVWRAKVRRVVRGADPIGGIESVYVNLIRGLDELGVKYVANVAFSELKEDDQVGVIGLGRHVLQGYDRPNPILAGVAVAAHPAEWVTLFEDYPVAYYVVHCDWVATMYERHYGPRIVKWAVGIDTNNWLPSQQAVKTVDFLVYDKVRWDHDRVHGAMIEPILDSLRRRGLTYEVIRYGSYRPEQFKAALERCRSMLFLCEHETQGLAYQQAMSCDVPILAWDPGAWLDPWRFRYGEQYVPATSVPFFDHRCGLTFTGVPDFDSRLDEFLRRRTGLAPRTYVLENLTLAGCAQKYLELLGNISKTSRTA